MPEIASARLSIDPSLLPVDADKRVLDVGCGDGRHVVEAARRGAIAVGVDYDAAELRKTRVRCGDVRVTLIVADAGHLPFVDSLVWLRFCLTDFLRPKRTSTAYEQAIAIAVAQERRVPSWRAQVRAAVGTSRFIRGVDAVGALVWPKSLAFVARKRAGR